MGKFNIITGRPNVSVDPNQLLNLSQQELGRRLGAAAVAPSVAPVPELDIPPAPVAAAPSVAPEGDVASQVGEAQVFTGQPIVGRYRGEAVREGIQSPEQQQLLAEQQAVTDLPVGLSQRVAETLGGSDLETASAISQRKSPYDSVFEVADRFVSATVGGPSEREVGISISEDPSNPALGNVFQKLGHLTTVQAPDYQGVVKEYPGLTETHGNQLALSSLAAIGDLLVQKPKTPPQDVDDDVAFESSEPGIRQLKLGDQIMRNLEGLNDSSRAEQGVPPVGLSPAERTLGATYSGAQAVDSLGLKVVVGEDGSNFLDIPPDVEALAKYVHKELAPLFQRTKKKPSVTGEVKKTRITKNYVSRDKKTDPAIRAAEIQDSMPFAHQATPTALAAALIIDANLNPRQGLGSSMTKTDDAYISKKTDGEAKAEVNLGKSNDLLAGTLEFYGKPINLPAAIQGRSNRINMDVDEEYDFQRTKPLRMIYGDVKPYILDASSSSPEVKAFLAGFMRLFAHKEADGTVYKEGDFHPFELYRMFKEQEGSFRSRIGDPKEAVAQIAQMEQDFQVVRNGVQKPIYIPEFLTNNFPELFTQEVDGFNKMVGLMELAKYFAAKESTGGTQFRSQLNVEMDGNANGFGIQAWMAGDDALAAATGMINADELYTFAGEQKVRQYIGQNILNELGETDLNIADPEVELEVRDVLGKLSSSDKFVKKLTTPSMYGQDPWSLNFLIEDYFNDNLDIKREMETLDVPYSQVLKILSNVSGNGMLKSIGRKTIENYTRPLAIFGLFGRVLDEPVVVDFPDGSTSFLSETSFQNIADVGSVTFYRGPERSRQVVQATQRGNVVDPQAIGGNPRHRFAGQGTVAKSSPVLTHSVDSAVERRAYDAYATGEIDYSYMQILDANVVPATKFFKHFEFKNGPAFKEVLEQQDPVRAVANTFANRMLPAWKKKVQELPDRIKFSEEIPIRTFLTTDGALEYFLGRLVVDPGLSAGARKSAATKMAEDFRSRMRNVIKPAQDGTISKQDYIKLTEAILDLFGGTQLFNRKAELNKRNRAKYSTIPSTQYS